MYLKGKNQKSPELNIEEMARIKDLFNRKHWPIQDFFDENVFENFCKMLQGLDKEQSELIISLTEKFLWIQEGEYIKHFSNVFDSFICSYKFLRGKKIYICPLLPEEDFGKSKSSVFLLYFVKAHLKAIHDKYPDFLIKYADSPSTVCIEQVKNDYTLCLIDDFVGTGETVEKASKYFLDRGVTQDKFVVLSLVNMKSGALTLHSKGYTTYTDISCDKGISEAGDEKQILIMQSIEKEIGVDDEFKFGYGASESLVRMIRTPNNTFPVYWFRNKEKNKFAPFPR